MAFNMDEVAQKQNRLIANIAEQNRKAYEMFYSPTPADVVLPQYDETGQLVDVTIPNRAKIKEQIWNDVETAMSKEFYVDAVNGNDINDGTQEAPFATLQQAVLMVPVCGVANIFIKNDLVHTSEQKINLSGRKIVISAHPDTPFATITFRNTTGLHTVSVDYHASVRILMNCVFENIYDTAVRVCIKCFDGGALWIGKNYQATIQNGTLVRSDVTVRQNASIVWSREASVQVENANIVTEQNSRLLHVGETGSSFGLNKASVSLNGNSPTDTIVASLCVGVIKSSYGIPRNIVSNIIF